jgi:NitT/TauT family transport system substrate-binding protein
MQNRRHFLTTGISMAAAGLAGAAALTGTQRSLAEEAPPETTALRLAQQPATCLAPLYILDELLHDEGFANVRYVTDAPSRTGSESIARGDVDFGQDLSPYAIVSIDAGGPIVMLAGVHSGCIELFARESIRGVIDLKGGKVGVPTDRYKQQILVSIIAAGVGLNPAKDIDWVVYGSRDPKELFDKGEIDAFLTVPGRKSCMRVTSATRSSTARLTVLGRNTCAAC